MSDRDFLRAAAFYLLKRAADEAAERVSREWDEKQRAWIGRQKENIARWEKEYVSNAGRIEKLAANVEKLEERLASTKNAAKTGEIGGWIDEANQKKARLMSRNRDLEGRVRDVEHRLTRGSATPFFYRDSPRGMPAYRSSSARVTGSPVTGRVRFSLNSKTRR